MLDYLTLHLDYPTLHLDTKEKEHVRLSNITLRNKLEGTC